MCFISYSLVSMETLNIKGISTPGTGNLTVGRGRGVLMYTPVTQSTPGNQVFSRPEFSGCGRGRMAGPPNCDVPPLTFTPGMSPVVPSPGDMTNTSVETSPSHLANLIKSIGSEIGESIRMTLMQNTAPVSSSVLAPERPQHVSQSDQCGSTVIDASKINLVLRSDENAPPYFRGDSSDKCSVFEWEELMRTYLRKKTCTGTEQVEEVMNKLMGRARDVTKVWMRSNSTVSEVSVIFSILRQHFGDTVHSDLPLADFYAVTPCTNESPLDYWIRLNKAAEVTEQCLSSKGEPMADLSRHLVLMFIRNCPDKELALVFKSKPSREWTAREVQDHLDEYLREHRAGRGRLTQNVVAIESSQETVVVNNKQSVSATAGCGLESEQLSSVSENNTMDRVLSLLEMALGNNTQSVSV